MISPDNSIEVVQGVDIQGLIDLGNRWKVYLDPNESSPLSVVYVSGPLNKGQTVFKLDTN